MALMMVEPPAVDRPRTLPDQGGRPEQSTLFAAMFEDKSRQLHAGKGTDREAAEAETRAAGPEVKPKGRTPSGGEAGRKAAGQPSAEPTRTAHTAARPANIGPRAGVDREAKEPKAKAARPADAAEAREERGEAGAARAKEQKERGPAAVRPDQGLGGPSQAAVPLLRPGVTAREDRAARRERGQRGTVALSHEPAQRRGPEGKAVSAGPTTERKDKGQRGGAAEKIVVIDLRTQRSESRPKAERETSEPRPALPAARVSGTPETAELREVRPTVFSVARPERGAETQPGQAVPPRFAETLQSEVVRHGTIVLRQGEGSGELRLVLHPEALGSVRVRLVMADGRLEGQIIVENSTVREMFETALPGIQSGLREQGFGMASLQVSVGHRQPDDRRREEHVAPRVAAREFDQSAMEPLGFEEALIDLVV